MTAHEEDRIKNLLKQALPPVPPDAEPQNDLWPAVLHRLDAEPVAMPRLVPWFDWALIGGLVLFVVSFPAAIPMVLYYL